LAWAATLRERVAILMANQIPVQAGAECAESLHSAFGKNA
jgi:hypothetical protein